MKTKRRLKFKVRTLLTFIIAIVLFGYVSFSVINYSVSKTKYQAEEEKLQAQLYELKDKETDLNQEISKLKDDDYLARYAREEYLYSKDGEYVIRIEDNEKEEVVPIESEVKVPEYVVILHFLIVGSFVAFGILFILKTKNLKKNKVSIKN